MNLLNDVFVIEQLTVLNEASQGKNMRIRGIFQRADEANNNKRIYSKKLLEREMVRLGESMKGRSLMGELDHPSYENVKLANVSHIVTNLSMRGNEMIGEAEILGTPAGQVAQKLIEGGVKIGISSRGMGTLSEGMGGVKHVNEDYRLVTFDLVADPSTRGAFPGLTESTEITTIVEDTLGKVVPEKVFITMLKEKLETLLEYDPKHGGAKSKTVPYVGKVTKDPTKMQKQGKRAAKGVTTKEKYRAGSRGEGHKVADPGGIKDLTSLPTYLKKAGMKSRMKKHMRESFARGQRVPGRKGDKIAKKSDALSLIRMRKQDTLTGPENKARLERHKAARGVKGLSSFNPSTTPHVGAKDDMAASKRLGEKPSKRFIATPKKSLKAHTEYNNSILNLVIEISKLI